MKTTVKISETNLIVIDTDLDPSMISTVDLEVLSTAIDHLLSLNGDRVITGIGDNGLNGYDDWNSPRNVIKFTESRDKVQQALRTLRTSYGDLHGMRVSKRNLAEMGLKPFEPFSKDELLALFLYREEVKLQLNCRAHWPAIA